MEGTMKAFKRVFHEELPVPGSLVRHWAKQDPAVLDSAAAKIESHGANPWFFTGDSRTFRQFAGDAEYAAFWELTEEEGNALLDWYEDYWREDMD
jgi:hypothetical protein